MTESGYKDTLPFGEETIPIHLEEGSIISFDDTRLLSRKKNQK